MALALRDPRPELSLHIVHDERVAAFVALGLGLGRRAGGAAVHEWHGRREPPSGGRRGRPVGGADARAHRRPAAGAARRRRAPDDRSDPAVRPVGALVPRSRASPTQPPLPRGARWRRASDRHRRVGPVHLNLPFREPLVGEPGELPPESDRPASAPVPPVWHSPRRRAGGDACGRRPSTGRDRRRRTPWCRSGRAIETLAEATRLAGPRRPAVGRRDAAMPPSRRSTRSSAIASSPTRTRRRSSCGSAVHPPRRCSPSGSSRRRRWWSRSAVRASIDPDHNVARFALPRRSRTDSGVRRTRRGRRAGGTPTKRARTAIAGVLSPTSR